MPSSSSIIGFVAALVGGALWTLSPGVMAGSAVTEGSKAAQEQGCVAPTPEMRRYHMDYLKHERDETVHAGIRGRKFSLAGCVDCHAAVDASGKALPIDGEGQFCDSCHNVAAVSVDCFGCHRDTPQTPSPGFFSIDAADRAEPGYVGPRAAMQPPSVGPGVGRSQRGGDPAGD